MYITPILLTVTLNSHTMHVYYTPCLRDIKTTIIAHACATYNSSYNICDMPKNPKVNIRPQVDDMRTAPPKKHDFLTGPNKGGETEILRKNAIIFTEHKIGGDILYIILCRDKRGSSNNIHLHTI